LKLKQHEIPPPGYFNTFSDQVIARLQSGEGRAQSRTERMHDQAPWLGWLLQLIDARPGVIGGFVTSLVLLLVIGVIISDRSDSMPDNILTATNTTTDSQPTASLVSMPTAMPTADLVAAGQPTGIVASTNPVTSLQPVATLFGQSSGSQLFRTASLTGAGN
jgi:hypothetical protein